MLDQNLTKGRIMKHYHNLTCLLTLSALLIASTTLITGCDTHCPKYQTSANITCYSSHMDAPYIVDTPVESRSISFENVTGAKGQGGKAESRLGVGRKGAPNKRIDPDRTITLCDIQGPGVIRHIWMTTNNKRQALLGQVIRAYWDNQKHPSIEAPIGNFFGLSHGLAGEQAYQSAAHSVNPNAGMNIWLPMPFAENARITITNESNRPCVLFYNIDYTTGEKLAEPFGRLHIIYRRENPTTQKEDFEILPKRRGIGRFAGCVLGIRTLGPHWFGEGEFKVYLDGDKKFPTIVGTGTEDYIGQSWGLQNKTYLYGGTSLNGISSGAANKLYSIYRWHLEDPVYWKKNVRITIQQIGYKRRVRLFERKDDWTTTTFWYEPVPSNRLPDLPDYESRIAGYDNAEDK